MKKILLMFLLAVATLSGFSQEPVAVDTAVAVEQGVPDSLCVTIKDERICLPTNDAEQATQIISEFVKENKGRWPSNLMGWITLLITFAFSIKGTQFLASLKGVYSFLKVFLKKTLHVVAFIAAAFSAGITFLVGKGIFDFQVFLTLWGITAFGAVYVYETWIKKDDSIPAAR